jgi:hypothetical protein
MRRCVLRNLNVNDVRRVVSLTIKSRLMNLVKKMLMSRKSIKKDWIRVINENYDSFRIKFAFCLNSSLTTLSSLLSFVIYFTLSSSFVTRLKKKKIEKRFSLFSFLWLCRHRLKRKKSKNNLCWFFFRSNLVIVFVNVIVYCLEVFVCVIIDFDIIFINIKKYDHDV